MSGRWPLGSEVKHSALAGGAMLYDASRVSNFAPAWFDPTYWKSRGELEGTRTGPGRDALLQDRRQKACVLRHYRRGGLVAHLSADKYFWRGEDNTRPFTEWQLTYRLHRAGLPVPAPIAARYVHSGHDLHGRPHHRATSDGADRWRSACAKARSPILTWILIGRCVRRFHDLGVCHADLNAHNVLLARRPCT